MFFRRPITMLTQLERRLADRLHRHGPGGVRVILGGVFLWFGLLKAVRISPAQQAIETVTQALAAPDWLATLWGWWELAVGVGLLVRPLIRWAWWMLMVQGAAVVLAVAMAPGLFFHRPPLAPAYLYVPTLLGHAAVMELALLLTAVVVAGSVRHTYRPW